MGEMNWLAAIIAPNLALAVGLVWYGPLFGGGRQLIEQQDVGATKPSRAWGLVIGALLISSLMLAHNFARIGADRLDDRPWLYLMMSGGLALAFVAPALFIGLARYGVPLRDRLVDCGFWLAAYLSMGVVFWALA
jgi:hypothetical protein